MRIHSAHQWTEVQSSPTVAAFLPTNKFGGFSRRLSMSSYVEWCNEHVPEVNDPTHKCGGLQAALRARSKPMLTSLSHAERQGLR